jgi:hypothetical protein
LQTANDRDLEEGDKSKESESEEEEDEEDDEDDHLFYFPVVSKNPSGEEVSVARLTQFS